MKGVPKASAFRARDPLNSPKRQLSVSFSCYPFSLTRFGATSFSNYVFRFAGRAKSPATRFLFWTESGPTTLPSTSRRSPKRTNFRAATQDCPELMRKILSARMSTLEPEIRNRRPLMPRKYLGWRYLSEATLV